VLHTAVQELHGPFLDRVLLDQYRLEAVGPKIGSMQGDVPHPYGSGRIVSSSCGSLEPRV